MTTTHVHAVNWLRREHFKLSAHYQVPHEAGVRAIGGAFRNE